MGIWKRIRTWILGPQVQTIDVEALPKDLTGWRNYKLTIHWDNGSRWVVRGEGTVWHRYPTGTRLPTELEAMCYDAVVAHGWKTTN